MHKAIHISETASSFCWKESNLNCWFNRFKLWSKEQQQNDFPCWIQAAESAWSRAQLLLTFHMWSKLCLLVKKNGALRVWESQETAGTSKSFLWPWWLLLAFLSLADQEIKSLSARCPIIWAWFALWAFPSLVTAPPVSTKQASSQTTGDD